MVKDVASAEEILRKNDYSLAIVESMLNLRPIETGEPTLEDGAEVGEDFMESFLSGKQGGSLTLSIPGLTGRSVDDLVQPASNYIPRFVELRPSMKVIVASHIRGGLDKEEKSKLAALPNVLGVFGWLYADATVKKVARMIAEHAG